ncbi:hypothetical protein KIPB_017211, partial [Kipferlia bialata]
AAEDHAATLALEREADEKRQREEEEEARAQYEYRVAAVESGRALKAQLAQANREKEMRMQEERAEDARLVSLAVQKVFAEEREKQNIAH